MSVCHQAHNIPWQLLCANLQLVHPDPRLARRQPESTDLMPRDRPSQNADLAHFARKMASTIRDFAVTERAKYPAVVKLKDQKVIPDALVGEPLSNGESVTEKQQSVAWWRSQADKMSIGRFGDGNLSNLIKKLYNLDCVESLLFLAQQEDLPIQGLRRVTYSNFFHYGTNRVYEDALAVYVCLNILLAFGYYGDGFVETRAFTKTRDDMTDSHDFDVQTDVQCEFFDNNESLQDVSRIKDYLKRLFRLLYLSEMVVTECGESVDWEVLVREYLSSYFHLYWDPYEE